MNFALHYPKDRGRNSKGKPYYSFVALLITKRYCNYWFASIKRIERNTISQAIRFNESRRTVNKQNVQLRTNK